MSESRSTEKWRFRKRWLLLPVLGVGLLIAITSDEGKPPAITENEFSTGFSSLAPEMDLRIVNELSGGWINGSDVPLITRLRVSSLGLRISALIRRRTTHLSIPQDYGSITFCVVDDKTQDAFEINMFFEEHQVRALAVHYAQNREKAVQIENELKKKFVGIPLVMRKGLIVCNAPSPMPPAANSNKITPFPTH